MIRLTRLLAPLRAPAFCADYWRKSSVLRTSVISLLLAGSGALWAPSAYAQDSVIFYAEGDNASTLGITGATLVVTDYFELSAPKELCGHQFVGFAEVVITGEYLSGDVAGSSVRGRIPAYVAVSNPLRTLKRGDRLDVAFSNSCLGRFVWHAQVVS